MTLIDIKHLQSWIGKTETLDDIAALAPLRGLTATLDRDDPPTKAGDAIPPCWHWLYFFAGRPAVRHRTRRPSGARRFPAAGAIATAHVGR